MTDQAVAVRDERSLAHEWTEERRALIQKTVAKGLTSDEFELFTAVARRTGLDPLSKQIYAIKRYDSREKREVMGIQIGIDGYRLVAQRTRLYAGQDGPYWCGEDGEWHEIWLSPDPPAAAKVGIKRKDWEEPVWGVARWRSYVQTFTVDGKQVVAPMWRKMPDGQLAKCAEALALRKAFPHELAGLNFTADDAELDQQLHGVHVRRIQRPALGEGEAQPATEGEQAAAAEFDEAEPTEVNDGDVPDETPADVQQRPLLDAATGRTDQLWRQVELARQRCQALGFDPGLPSQDQDDTFLKDWLARQDAKIRKAAAEKPRAGAAR